MSWYKQLKTRAERAVQLLATGEWEEFSQRLARKLTPKGAPPAAMNDPIAYGKWLERRTEVPPAASERTWDVLTVVEDGELPVTIDTQAHGVRLLVADCRPGHGRNNTLPAGVRGRPALAWEFLCHEATAEWIVFLPSGATLHPHAFGFLNAAAVDTVDVIYGDNDLIQNGVRVSPHLHPTWSPERFLSDGYALPAIAMRRTLVDALRYRPELGLFDLVLRAEEKGARIHRVPHVLVHLAHRPALVDKKSAQLALGRRKLDGHVSIVDGRARIVSHARREQAVSIIIPFRDKFELLDRCLDSVMSKTRHKRFEVILVDNGSREATTHASVARWQGVLGKQGQVLHRSGAFNFSWLNNEAAKVARHPFLVLLNNDTEVVTADWLDEMITYAARPDVGAVGAKLLFPDGTLQHAGVALGVGGAAAHVCLGLDAMAPGHAGQLLAPRNVSAVTGACLMVEKHKYQEVGGLDEMHFRVAFNDIDLCLKLASRGWRTVYTPHAVLLHHESKSRGSRVELREDREFRSRWAAAIADDPFYHPALSHLVADDRLA